MSDQKQVTQFTRTVYSTESFVDLQRRVSEAGARIIGTTSLRDGAGISVTIEIDGDKRQF